MNFPKVKISFYRYTSMVLAGIMAITFIIAGLEPKYFMSSVWWELGWRIFMVVMMAWNFYILGWNSGYDRAKSTYMPIFRKGEFADDFDSEATPMAEHIPFTRKPTFRPRNTFRA